MLLNGLLSWKNNMKELLKHEDLWSGSNNMTFKHKIKKKRKQKIKEEKNKKKWSF